MFQILAKKDGHTIDGKVVDCKHALPQRLSKEPRVKKLFVGGLPNEVTEEQLRDYFGKFGTVSMRCVRDSNDINLARVFE